MISLEIWQEGFALDGHCGIYEYAIVPLLWSNLPFHATLACGRLLTGNRNSTGARRGVFAHIYHILSRFWRLGRPPPHSASRKKMTRFPTGFPAWSASPLGHFQGKLRSHRHRHYHHVIVKRGPCPRWTIVGIHPCCEYSLHENDMID